MAEKSTMPPSSKASKPIAHSKLLSLATDTIQAMTKHNQPLGLGRIRGSSPRVHLSKLLIELDTMYPVELDFPFEKSERVGGGLWGCSPADGHPAIAKLRWLEHADDLPLHTHEHSDRFIIVIDGRGFFHWSDQTVDGFNGKSVRTIAARDRDVFAFRRGLLHTFSTHDTPMTLLSVQCPFIPFDNAQQYTLPPAHWIAQHNIEAQEQILCFLHAPTQANAI